jgi:hypothetical protein
MKRFALVSALLGALALSGIAMAGTEITTPGNSSGTGANSKGTSVTHYTTSYTDGWFGDVSCTGVHQVKAKQPTQDSFTCTSTTGSPLGVVTPGETLSYPGNYPGWNSDFDGAFANTFNATVSADGMSYTAVATY